MNCLIRCGLGFLIGRTLASVWCALFASAATEATVETETEIANTAVEEGTTKIAA